MAKTRRIGMARRDKADVGPTLNEILRSMGVDSDALSRATDEYYDRRRYGEYLVSQGIITRAQLSHALSRQAACRGNYDESWQYAVEAHDLLNESEREHIEHLGESVRLMTAAAIKSRS